MSAQCSAMQLGGPFPAPPIPIVPAEDQAADADVCPAEAFAREGRRGCAASLDDLLAQTLPQDIRQRRPLDLPPALSESEALERARQVASQNIALTSLIGQGYYGTILPPVIQRNILENPAWYTAYTPYQAEIAQGRLEALLNFQTMVIDLTGMEIANASLLDEATAAAEAMTMSYGIRGKEGKEVFFVSDACHPQTIDVVRTRAGARGITIVVGDVSTAEIGADVFGVLLQYPTTDGAVVDNRALCDLAHSAGALVTVAADLLSLVLLTPPGEWGADVVVGNTQRMGVPIGYGGPHAAFFATRDEFKRQIPGRIIGVSRDVDGKSALRMALQTREQHIRREKATSNVCTAQVLLAVVASMYAVYHGPDGLRRIASRIHQFTAVLAESLKLLGLEIAHEEYFDTIRVELGARSASDIIAAAAERKINLRQIGDHAVCIALDETVSEADLVNLVAAFGGGPELIQSALSEGTDTRYDERFKRTTPFMQHAVFN